MAEEKEREKRELLIIPIILGAALALRPRPPRAAAPTAPGAPRAPSPATPPQPVKQPIHTVSQPEKPAVSSPVKHAETNVRKIEKTVIETRRRQIEEHRVTPPQPEPAMMPTPRPPVHAIDGSAKPSQVPVTPARPPDYVLRETVSPPPRPTQVVVRPPDYVVRETVKKLTEPVKPVRPPDYIMRERHELVRAVRPPDYVLRAPEPRRVYPPRLRIDTTPVRPPLPRVISASRRELRRRHAAPEEARRIVRALERAAPAIAAGAVAAGAAAAAGLATMARVPIRLGARVVMAPVPFGRVALGLIPGASLLR